MWVSPWCIVISLLGRLSFTERKLLNQGFLVVITSEVFRSQTWLGLPLRNICVINHHWYVPLLNTFRSAFMSFHWLCNKRNTTGVTFGAGTTHPVCLTLWMKVHNQPMSLYSGLFSINYELVRSTAGLNPACINQRFSEHSSAVDAKATLLLEWRNRCKTYMFEP